MRRAASPSRSASCFLSSSASSASHDPLNETQPSPLSSAELERSILAPSPPSAPPQNRRRRRSPTSLQLPFSGVCLAAILLATLASLLSRTALTGLFGGRLPAASLAAVRKMSSFPSMGEPVVLPPILQEGEKQRGTIIFSHGLGDSALGWLDFAEYLQRKNEVLRGVKWVLTNAPKRPVTVNGGAVMQAWYDTLQPNAPPSLEDVEGMLASADSLRSLIAAEVEEGVEEGRIVVGGFSQGGVLSLLTGLTHPEKPLGGIACLSGFLPLTHEDKLLSLTTEASRHTPLLWTHGRSDPVIRFSRAQTGRAYLTEKLGRSVVATEGEGGEGGKGEFVWKEYVGMGHELGREEVGDVERWLEGRFA